jgi:hypothetical protein
MTYLRNPLYELYFQSGVMRVTRMLIWRIGQCAYADHSHRIVLDCRSCPAGWPAIAYADGNQSGKTSAG